MNEQPTADLEVCPTCKRPRITEFATICSNPWHLEQPPQNKYVCDLEYAPESNALADCAVCRWPIGRHRMAIIPAKGPFKPVEPPSSNPLVKRLRQFERTSISYQPALAEEAADELERLSFAETNAMSAYQVKADEAERLTREAEQANYRADENYKLVERLTRERDELVAVSHLAREFHNIDDIAEIRRLRAALERIIATESVDNDGEPMPETGACFIAREALAGHKEHVTAPNVPSGAADTTAAPAGLNEVFALQRAADALVRDVQTYAVGGSGGHCDLPAGHEGPCSEKK